MISGIKALTYGEYQSCRQRLADFFGNGPGTTIPGKVDEAVIAVFAAFYRSRFGPAPGSTAGNAKTGQSAMRYYDAQLKTFRWLVMESPENSELHAERMDNLPAEGKGWVITEQSWEGLVYK